MAESVLDRLTSGRLLARNTVFNLLGQGIPLLVGLFAIPILVNGLGTHRFGVLTLAWLVVGYFGLLDLGLGRTLTKMVAERLAAEQEQEIPALVWTGLVVMMVFGLGGALATVLISPWLVRGALKVPEALQPETLRAFYVLTLSFPFVTGALGLRGVLMAQQRFGLINAVRIPMSTLVFAGPLLALPFSRSLVPAMAILVVGRVIAWLAYLLLCLRVSPKLRLGVRLQRSLIRPLVNFGGWITTGTITGSALATMDRLLVGTLVSTAAVAYYAAPHAMITKFVIIPSALVEVLFSAFSASFVQDRNRTALLFSRGTKYVFLTLFPVTLIIVTLASEGLNLWLGAEFAKESTRALQWLAIGVLINSVALVPWTLLQGGGRPDLAAKLNLIELPIYALVLWWAIESYGIEGAGVAWALRALVDAVALFFMMRRLLPSGTLAARRVALAALVAMLVMVFAMLLDGIAAKGTFLLLAMGVFIPVSWFFVLTSDERAPIRDIFGQVRRYVRPESKK